MSQKKIKPENEKKFTVQNFFAMSQNLHIIFLNFLKKIECLGQIFQLWDTAKKFWDNFCFGTKKMTLLKIIFPFISGRFYAHQQILSNIE